MFFRFGSAVCLVVVISLLGIAIEKRNLELRRAISRQHYRMDVLLDEHARLRLRAQELAAVEGLFDIVEGPSVDLKRPPGRPVPSQPEPGRESGSEPASERARRPPVLFFQRPPIDLRLEAPAR